MKLPHGMGHTIDTNHRPAPTEAPILFAVDDDAATLALLSDIAADSGWVVRGFTRLKDLRTKLAAQKAKPSLVILDDDLPDGSGGDLARDLRADPRMEGVPVLVCTGAHPMRQAEIGAWAPVVSKPFDLAEIERFLHAAAGRQPRQHAAG